MKYFTIPVAAVLLFTACHTAPERDFFTLLPTSPEKISYTERLSAITIHREGEHCIIKLKYKPEQLQTGYQLAPVLQRTAYHSMWNRTRCQSLAAYTTTSPQGDMRIAIPAAQLRHSGGPWDYSFHLQQLAPDGSRATIYSSRLYSECPPPHATWSNPPNRFGTYAENCRSLNDIRQAARNCTAARVLTADFHTGEKATRALSATELEELRRLIGHMQPVRTAIGIIYPSGYHITQLVAADGRAIAEIHSQHLTSPRRVSPENVAQFARYILPEPELATWYKLTSIQPEDRQ